MSRRAPSAGHTQGWEFVVHVHRGLVGLERDERIVNTHRGANRERRTRRTAALGRVLVPGEPAELAR